MLRLKFPEIALGVLLGIVVSLFFGAVGSYQSTHCLNHQSSVSGDPSQQEHSATTAPKQSSSEHDKPSKHGKPEPITCGVVGLPGALVTYMDSHEGFFVGAFTGCLFFATVLLWRVTNDTLKHAERTAERQLRAYVLTEGGAIKLLQEELAFDGRRAHVEFHIRVKNFGQTPAYNLTNWMFIDVFDWDYTGPFTAAPPPDQRPSSSPLGPGNGTFLNDWRTISPKSFAGIKDGTKAIFIWGEVNYVDAFGNERFVKFRMGNGRPTSAAAGEPERPGWPLFPHKEGNDAN